jgi:hypothetical protein
LYYSSKLLLDVAYDPSLETELLLVAKVFPTDTPEVVIPAGKVADD